MQNKFRETRQGIIIFIMNIVIVVMCIIMVICAGTAASCLYDDYSMPYDERSMYYRIEDGDFGRMVSMYHTNIQEGFKGNKAMKEYYGVAKYYEAASYYKMYSDAGDTECAEREKAKMEEALVEMGSWSIVEKDIKKQLGIE